VLVGCEESGAVRDAFAAAGHDAMSADLQPSAGNHYQGDVFDLVGERFDLVVLHPPCTYLAKVSAPVLARDPDRRQLLTLGAEFFRRCLDWPAPMVAVENPHMLASAMRLIGRRPTQWVEPWQFGDPYTKHTGLWLRGLPPLVPDRVVAPVMGSWVTKRRDSVGRSKTFAGVARAMAEQWPGGGGAVELW